MEGGIYIKWKTRIKKNTYIQQFEAKVLDMDVEIVVELHQIVITDLLRAEITVPGSMSACLIIPEDGRRLIGIPIIVKGRDQDILLKRMNSTISKGLVNRQNGKNQQLG